MPYFILISFMLLVWWLSNIILLNSFKRDGILNKKVCAVLFLIPYSPLIIGIVFLFYALLTEGVV